MDFKDAEQHNEFVRLDAAAVALLLIIAGIISSFLYDITFLLGFLSFAFMIVGFSVAWEWRNELAENNMVEADPLQAVLVGTLFILALQTGFGYLSFNLGLIPSILYGIISGTSYTFLVLLISFWELPGEGYKTRYHPRKSGTDKYVFEEYYYINLVEEEALSRADSTEEESSPEPNTTTED